jgi:endoglucanase
VTVSASASTGYLASAASTVSSAAVATEQLNAPGIPTAVANGTTGLTVSYSASSNAPSGQIYSVEVCTNQSMSSGCVTKTTANLNYPFTGLSTSTAYWSTVTASASTGYLVSTASESTSSTTS